LDSWEAIPPTVTTARDGFTSIEMGWLGPEIFIGLSDMILIILNWQQYLGIRKPQVLSAGNGPGGRSGCPTELHPRPAPDEFTSVGKLPLGADGHVIGLPIPAMVKSTFDAIDTGDAGKHTLDFHLEIR
jgi:hypothetical protein